MTAVSDETGRVAIKPLEWQGTFIDRGDGSQDQAGWEADTGFGVWYEIEQYFGSDSYGYRVSFDYEMIGDHDDPDQAKVTAQKHFEKRIRAALSASPVAQEPVARVSNDRCKLDDDPAPVASVTQVCSCSETCAADGITPVSKPAPQYDILGRRMEPVAMPDAQKDALARCYGRLWLVYTDNKSIHLARRELLSWLTKDEQAWGIEHAKTEALAWPSHTSTPATPAGLGADEIARALMHELLAQGVTFVASIDLDKMANAILALLSRAGDQK